MSQDTATVMVTVWLAYLVIKCHDPQLVEVAYFMDPNTRPHRKMFMSGAE